MKNILSILIITVIISACTDKIDVELEDTYTRLVVEGIITTDTMNHYVRLTKTTSYYYSKKPPVVTGANITISNGDTTFILAEKEPGFYIIDPPISGITGKTYSLDIQLSEPINNETHYASSSYINPIASIDSIKAKYWSAWEFWEIKLWAQDPVRTDFYMFNFEINGRLVTDTIDEVIVTDDILFNGNYTNGIGVAWLNDRREDQKLTIGDTATIIMSNITEAYANFLWELQEESGYQIPLFSGPPANISSNISNGALGFFAAYSNEHASTIITEKTE